MTFGYRDLSLSSALAEYRELSMLRMNHMLASAVQPGQEHQPVRPRPDLVGMRQPGLPLHVPGIMGHLPPLPTPTPASSSAGSSHTATPEASPGVQSQQQKQQQQQQKLAAVAADPSTAAAGPSTATAHEAVKVTKDKAEGANGSERNAWRKGHNQAKRGRPKGAKTDPARAAARKERKAPYPPESPTRGA